MAPSTDGTVNNLAQGEPETLAEQPYRRLMDADIAELQMRRHIAAARLRRERAIEGLQTPKKKLERMG